MPDKHHDKSFRGNASQFFVAAELCRRGYAAVVTLGNTPNVDILCSNGAGTNFVHIQVKTFLPGNRMRIPIESGHPFRLKADSVPIESGQRSD